MGGNKMKTLRAILFSAMIFLLFFPGIVRGDTAWTTEQLTYNSGISQLPSIAVDGSNIYVVWQDDTPGNSEIFLNYSTDGGTTWTTKQLTSNSGSSENPSIAVNDSNIYVVWQDDTPGNSQIYFEQSTDGGTTWKTKRLSNNSGSSENPSIAVNDSNIYVVWQDDTPGENQIYFKQSTDGGTTWKTKKLTKNSGSSENPSIAVNDSNIYVVWQDDTPGNSEIFLNYSTDSGTTWTTKQLTSNSGSSENPSIAVNDSNIYVVWQDDTPGNSEIFLNYSTDGGTTWESNESLTDDVWPSENPSVALDGSNIYVVWQDVPEDSTAENVEIFLNKGVVVAEIDRIEPDFGPPRMIVSIYPAQGDFGEKLDKDRVQVGEYDSIKNKWVYQNVPIYSWLPKEIKFRVRDMQFNEGVHYVRVKKTDIYGNLLYVTQEKEFNIREHPEISSLTPSSGTYDTDVSINGAGFGELREEIFSSGFGYSTYVELNASNDQYRITIYPGTWNPNLIYVDAKDLLDVKTGNPVPEQDLYIGCWNMVVVTDYFRDDGDGKYNYALNGLDLPDNLEGTGDGDLLIYRDISNPVCFTVINNP
jgi:hypothetical protein